MEGWQAVAHAGIDPGLLKGENWGVFAAVAGDYGHHLKDVIGVSPNVTHSSIPGRLAYTLDLGALRRCGRRLRLVGLGHRPGLRRFDVGQMRRRDRRRRDDPFDT